MLLFKLIISIFLFFPAYSSRQDAKVIFITFDGVRAQDFLEKKNLPKLWSEYGSKAVYGPMHVINKANVSLPGYQSIFAGHDTGCMTNECARTPKETLGERLLRELKIPREKIAAVASWEKIPLAFESVQGRTWIDAGFTTEEQRKDRPTWEENRFDKYTWSTALEVFKRQKPIFLYISLNDSDDYGHLDQFENYLGSLRMYDGWVTDLLKKLKADPDYANATVILSTDHGRGQGKDFKDHHEKLPSAAEAWFFALDVGRASALKKYRFHGKATHADLRPLIESLFGITPQKADFAAQ